MKTYTFELVLHGLDDWTDQDADRLFEAGCDDGSLQTVGRVTSITFDREAESANQAISSAIRDVQDAGLDAKVARVEPAELVTAAEMANRLELTRAAVMHWINGDRGPGDFPPPVGRLGRNELWNWPLALAWLLHKTEDELGEDAPELENLQMLQEVAIAAQKLNARLAADSLRATASRQAAATRA